MKHLGGVLVLATMIGGILWLSEHGYRLLRDTLGYEVDNSYGVLGEQLEHNPLCRDGHGCSGLENVGQDLKEINDGFQQVLGTSSGDNSE